MKTKQQHLQAIVSLKLEEQGYWVFQSFNPATGTQGITVFYGALRIVDGFALVTQYNDYRVFVRETMVNLRYVLTFEEVSEQYARALCQYQNPPIEFDELKTAR